jgi:putative peptide zinc metalloprotease protein
MIVPFLREDLQLLPGSTAEDGSPSWLLYDVLRNKYFSLGKTAFQLLSHWIGGKDLENFMIAMKKKGLQIEQHEAEELINFLSNNSLIIHSNRHDIGLLMKENESQNKNWFINLIHNYLFFRIPLVKPDQWLKKTLPIARFFSSKSIRYVIYFLGILGVFSVIQQWEDFIQTFLYFFSWKGLFFYGLSLFAIKALHELGHAYTAKNYGCHVPSMGLAMLVFFPFLYTDTTNAWKLRNHKDRLNIDLSGVLIEIHLALIATFLWAVLPDGTLKSIMFFIATTGWIASLIINISPFMKFDGYYVLSDWLKAENLQPRSFALAKWKLRKWLFDFKDEPPEILEKFRQNIFIIYAALTWIYRLFLFIGIAFLIYHFAFKVLGIFLFIVEMIWFVALPIFKEILVWYKMRSKIQLTIKFFRTILLLSALGFIFFYPWQSNIKLPAIYSAENFITLFPTQESRVTNIYVQEGQQLKKDEVLLELNSTKINFQISQNQNKIQIIQHQLNNVIGSEEYLKKSLTLKSELVKLENSLNNLNQKKETLVIKAPFNSELTAMPDIHAGQWVNKLTPLATLVDKSHHIIHAFISEKDLYLFNIEQEAHFLNSKFTNKNIRVNIVDISDSPEDDFSSYAMLTSIYHGPIAVREINKNGIILKSEDAYYKITLKPSSPVSYLDVITPGVILLETKRFSSIERFYKYIWAIIIRESNF